MEPAALHFEVMNKNHSARDATMIPVIGHPEMTRGRNHGYALELISCAQLRLSRGECGTLTLMHQPTVLNSRRASYEQPWNALAAARQ
jgi:hypothetical protein